MTPVVVAARAYLNVRFVHRGRLPHKLDCVGLVWRAFKDAGVDLPCPSDYGREPNLPRFMATIVEGLGPDVGTRDLQPGDVVTLRTANHPHHLAIVGDYPGGLLSLIHASGEHGRVVEHRLSPEYLARIVTAHRRSV